MNVKVICYRCNIQYDMTLKHYNMSIKRNSKHYCSKSCKHEPIEKRFWDKVNKTTNIKDCWEWKAGSRGLGYGTITYNKKQIDAHRLSWMMANNKYNLASKDFICHKCDNPKCVNPNHLFLGNHSINMKDAYYKGRSIMSIINGYKI